MNPIKCSHTVKMLHLLPLYDIKVVSIISLVNDMFINFDYSFKHGIEDLRKLFLQGTHKKKKMALTFAEKPQWPYLSLFVAI
jgi:hypothetical protein